jgi:hypothetical protein
VNDIEARFEFRVFDAGADGQDHRTTLGTRFGTPRPDESRDIYLITGKQQRLNVKLRRGQVDVKILIEARAGLQRWQPLLSAAPPLEARWRERLERDHGLPESVTRAATATALLAAAELDTDVFVAHCLKRRWKFARNELLAEVAEIQVNGAAVTSTALESNDPQSVSAARRDLGLSRRTNLAFTDMLQQLFGLTTLTDDHPNRVHPEGSAE